ncbi:UV DNA damage repair endonuclease UvsE [Litchfieldia alkalitelluris]|uniref:UV DNA damage repair endonuclease UvsE n=1 Tax=Litchfieldia alkalitelluris TaxID=304268 RepID=UPI000997F9A5|nr:UV DNA damage repair endonuclease UvsE [Litchfieldia alkalitelluris]
MTIVRLGYVAMSMNLQNSSPSQTMTVAQFQKIKDREAAISKLERIAISNLENCLRLLKYNAAHDIHFFRLSSRLIPLAGHEEVSDWKFMRPLKHILEEIGEFTKEHSMRVGFHPDHFVVFTTEQKEIIKQSIKNLMIHEALLRGMNIDREHRCVIHVGGAYNDKDRALEQFIENWGNIPVPIQKMIMLENDDTTFTLLDTLYLCEKLSVPIVFDYHHHLAHHEVPDWESEWERVVGTWSHSRLPLKMHISSPRNEKEFRAHADYIDDSMFMRFLSNVKGSVDEMDCMIEAKQKDNALFKLVEDLKKYPEIEFIDASSFKIH